MFTVFAQAYANTALNQSAHVFHCVYLISTVVIHNLSIVSSDWSTTLREILHIGNYDVISADNSFNNYRCH